jgi:pilus assembly protein CpaF
MSNDLQLLISFMEPIKELLLDDSITEIMGNPNGAWFIERGGRLYEADGVAFESKKLLTGLNVVANKLGKKFDDTNPILNAQLPDGSRLAALIPPIVKPNPSVTIRKFSKVRYTIEDLIKNGAMTHEVARFLQEVVEGGHTMLISGGTGSGKTTLLNALTDFIPNSERIIVIEDTSELRINKPNLLCAECQTDAHVRQVNFDHLLRASLRWRPDRIILGEVRGEGARTLLDSFNTGHAGSMATIHASSPLQATGRFAELAKRSHQQSNLHDIAAEIGDCVSYVVQCGRFAEGRKISGIIRLKGYNRVAQFQEHETIFNLGGKDGHTRVHPQMFGTPTQLCDPSATTPKEAFVWDESMAIK